MLNECAFSQVLIYHGSLDIICHFPGAQEMFARTNWTRKDEFHMSERRAVWFYNEVKIVILFTLNRVRTEDE